MRQNHFKLLFVLIIFGINGNPARCQLFEWRGPGRSGTYNETGLLKKWPESGPSLIWEANSMGDGYSSPTVTDDAIYVTGRRDNSDVLTALTMQGKKKWEVVYGNAWMANHTGSRCTPTYYNGRIFLISGEGDLVCVGPDGKIKWSKNHYRMFEGSRYSLGFPNLLLWWIIKSLPLREGRKHLLWPSILITEMLYGRQNRLMNNLSI